MKKKLIEVALPLEAINVAAAREKSIRHGHPSTLHLWWARRPLAACRAVLFASLVDDPSSHPEKFRTEKAQDKERQRLFRIIEDLVLWENSNNEEVLNKAREEILKSTGGNPPPVYDPFCGGGSIPLEAQRLGLEAYGSDLNPVAVLITKALIEIPPKFAGMPPIHPDQDKELVNLAWNGTAGLAEDVRYYGQWMRDEAEKRIGHLYPKVKLPKEHGGGEATVIAWLWARTVKCPNPACNAQMPLVSSYWLSKKSGKQAWLEAITSNTSQVRFEVRTGKGIPAPPPKLGRGAKFRCLCCNSASPENHIKAEGAAGRIGAQLLAIVAEGKHGRVYLNANHEQERIAQDTQIAWRPEQELANDPRNLWCIPYGLTTFGDLFTSRQLLALTTFSDLVTEARGKVLEDIAAQPKLWRRSRDSNPLNPTPEDYANAVATYLAFAVDKLADLGNSLNRWEPVAQCPRQLFGRQAIPMIWDFAEGNPLGNSSGAWSVHINNMTRTFANPAFSHSRLRPGYVKLLDATNRTDTTYVATCVSTDPPYYDNIAYADLSDFFYVWLRRSLGAIYPDLFTTLLVPKEPELVATPYRFGGSKEKAQHFFEDGLGRVFDRMRHTQHPDYPLTVYYAFKQSEDDGGEEEDGDLINKNGSSRASTGWETMLEGLLKAGFVIVGTWPSRTECKSRMVGQGTNALASSIVLVCRPRSSDASLATRRELIAALKRELPHALRMLQRGNIAPVDLAQAAIGPGMAVFSRYAKVVEPDGSPMRVRTALALINETLDEVLTEQEGEFDADTRWALAWFEQIGIEEGAFGTAETLSKAKNTSVQGMVEAGILMARAGKVRLLRREELETDWDPATDRRLTVWETAQHLIYALETQGEIGAADLLRKVGALGEVARDLAYRLYILCERKGWTQEAIAYNSLVIAWPEITKLAASTHVASGTQEDLLQT